MKNERTRIPLMMIVVTALVASILWSFYCLQPEPSVPVQQVYAKFFNDYRIISGKALSIWPEGTVFEQGRTAYFYAAEPIIKVSPTVRIYGLEEGEITGTIESKVYIQAVSDKSEVYWSYPLKDIPALEFSLTGDVTDQSTGQEFITDEITLDAVYAYDLATKIGEELLFRTGQFQLVVASDLHLSGSIEKNNIDRQLSNNLTIILQQASFSAPKQNDISVEVPLIPIPDPLTFNERIIKTAISNPYPFVLNAALLIFMLILILRKGEKSKAAIQHKKFKDWITEGSVVTTGKHRINVFTLEGLVDLAIDMDRRVIFDPRARKYYVMEENMLYIFDPVNNKTLMDNKQQMGKLLVENGIISPQQLETGLYYHQRIGTRLGESLIALGFINETTLYSVLATQSGFDYYELNENADIIDNEWIDILDIEKARIFQVIPLGNRDDGKLVVACGDVSKKGLYEALKELFNDEVYIVAAKPSAIFERLNYIQKRRDNHIICATSENDSCSTQGDRLSGREREEFKNSYYRGEIMYDLLLKASGKVDASIIDQASEHDNLLNWLVNNNKVNDEFANLLKGLGRTVESMDAQSRREKQIPSLAEILIKANYLTSDSIEWVNNEFPATGQSIEEFMVRNYLVSEKTIESAAFILDIFKSIIQC